MRGVISRLDTLLCLSDQWLRKEQSKQLSFLVLNKAAGFDLLGCHQANTCNTYLLHTPWSRDLLHELTGSQLVMKLPACCVNPKIHYRIHKCPPPVSILSQIDLFETPTSIFHCGKWVSVTTAWRVFRLRMEERPPIRRVAADILNKQSRTADKGWSSSLEVGRGVKNSLP